jgi:hypothetical protein
MALSASTGPKFEVHPGCECLPLPTVAAAPKVSLPTGGSLFGALSKPEQEKAIGAEPAHLVREGEADLKDFVGHSSLETDQPNFITQKPVQDVA